MWFSCWDRRAAGKTALSLALGERFGGEIVSCDSVAVYRGMDLGTAKPTSEERARLPHHLIDVAEPDQPFTAGEYSRAGAGGTAGDCRARPTAHRDRRNRTLPARAHRRPLCRALRGRRICAPACAEAQRNARQRLAAPHAARLDPASAARIHANDTPKLIRAIEVCLAARKPLSEVMARDPLTGFRLLRIGLNPPRQALYDRLNQRSAAMFAAGLVEETRALLERYGPVKALDSLGYRQALAVLRRSP